MNLNQYIQAIQEHLIQTHGEILRWFNLDDRAKAYRPRDNGWSIAEILEHIALTSHYLMILIDKGADKALKSAHASNLEAVLRDELFDLSRIDQIGVHKSFDWIRPEHMEPSGEKSELEIKAMLISQLTKCLKHLENLKDGHGLLYKTTMTVNGLGKLNVYEYILFLSKHAERHLAQMRENLMEMETSA